MWAEWCVDLGPSGLALELDSPWPRLFCLSPRSGCWSQMWGWKQWQRYWGQSREDVVFSICTKNSLHEKGGEERWWHDKASRCSCWRPPATSNLTWVGLFLCCSGGCSRTNGSREMLFPDSLSFRWNVSPGIRVPSIMRPYNGHQVA